MKLTFKSIFMAAALAGFTAALVNAVLFFIFHATGVISDDILLPPSNNPMTVVPIVMSSILPSLLSAIVFYLLERFTNKGFRIFNILAVVLLLISFINPFMGIPGVTMGYAIALNIMHVVVVGFLLYYYGRLVNKPVPLA